MKLIRWDAVQRLRALLQETAPSPARMAVRLRAVERNIILPVKAVFVGILFCDLYYSRWFEDLALPQSVPQQIVERFFLIYMVLNAVVALLLIFSRRLPSLFVQRMIFSSNFVDGLFLAALTFLTGGFDSILYWIFLGLIVRNAVSSPLAVPQLILNFSVILCYLTAGLLDLTVKDDILDYNELSRGLPENPTEPFLLRLFVLALMAACCYGIQVLFEKQRQAAEEAREFAARQEQLRTAGQLAAQIAHQIKNPLGIINNAAYTIQRALQDGKSCGPQQVQIIREEVERADRIITEVMGYAQLAEGKVEKLKIDEELDRAIAEVLPPFARYEAKIERHYAPHLPVLLAQRRHLSEIFVNLLQNAREATGGRGRIEVSAASNGDESVTVTIADDGPGIAPGKLDKIFQPYFTTKEKGTGLGLSIVKHNAEMYGGTLRVESELGKGAKFVVQLPTRTFMKSQS